MAPADRLFVFAKNALNLVINAWPDDPNDASPLPDLQYVTFGEPAWDCDQFTVSIQRTFGMEADVSQETITSVGTLIAMRAIVLDFQIIRCQPTVDVDTVNEIELPTPEELEGAAHEIAIDAETMRQVLVAGQMQGNLGAFQGQGLAFENWRALTPAGGYGGGVLTARISLV